MTGLESAPPGGNPGGQQRAELEPAELGLALPPGPLCERCGHDICETCLSRCHYMLPGGHECRCGCTVNPIDLLWWMAELAEARELAGVSPHGYTPVALGPWLPVSVRAERGLPGSPGVVFRLASEVPAFLASRTSSRTRDFRG